MGEEEPKKAELEPLFIVPTVEKKGTDQNYVTEDQEKEDIADPAVKKSIDGSIDRDAVFAQIETEKRLALIKAWEESEKTKAENKAYKRMSAVELWENNKKTSVEAQLRKIEENFEKKKAEYAEKMKNKVAEIHKAGEEKRALIEAKQREESLKVEETAAKFYATGYTPKKLLGCFSYKHSVVF